MAKTKPYQPFRHGSGTNRQRNETQREVNTMNKTMSDTSAQTELIPMCLWLFISTAFLFTLAFVVPPAFQVVYKMSEAMDTTGSIYYDVVSQFNIGVNMWYFFLVLIIVIQLIHMGLVALKKQRYTGEQHAESDF